MWMRNDLQICAPAGKYWFTAVAEHLPDGTIMLRRASIVPSCWDANYACESVTELPDFDVERCTAFSLAATFSPEGDVSFEVDNIVRDKMAFDGFDKEKLTALLQTERISRQIANAMNAIATLN